MGKTILDKNCTKCNKTKSVKEFNFKYKTKGIRHTHCKDCKKKYLKAHYIKNIDAYKKKSKKSNATYKKIKKIAILEIKMGNPCNICGENDPRVLDFDHINPKFKKYSISDLTNGGGYSFKTILKEMSKCQILCANCHRIKTSIDNNWFSFDRI